MTLHFTMRRLLATAALALALPFATLADAKDLTIGLTSDPTILDPQAGEELSSNIMFYHVYDPLVRRDADLQVRPGPCRKLVAEGRQDLGVQAAAGREVSQRRKR